jgi:hypothetical protein
MFPKLKTLKKFGDERFSRNRKPLDIDILSFWRWSASDLVSNATRGVLAEYIVASALGLTDGVREEWDAFDLRTKDSVRIEVKSASYIQSWYHKNLSKITFGIQPTRGWDAATNQLANGFQRQAHIYVFCLLAHKDQDTLNPLDLDQWEFYFLPAQVLNATCPAQKTIGLAKLLKLGAIKADYDGIQHCIERLAAALPTTSAESCNRDPI